jgi:predicted MFS family arabinose efflux permease
VDAADKALLPASFMALSQEFGIGPAQLGALTFAQSVAFSISLPLWAPMLRCCSSRDLLAGGCFLWGGLTILIACTSSFSLQFTLRLLVGAALAVVNPVGQALICDVVQESERGRAFGLMQSVSNALAMVVTFGTTAVATTAILGVSGWRLAYVLVACMSLCTGVLVCKFLPNTLSTPRPVTSCCAEQRRVLSSVASKPSFIIMVAQGVTFGIPGNALAFLTLFFQVSGYADVQAGLIMLGGGIGSVGAGLLGGMLGDYYNVHFPLTGRVAVAQTSVVLGIGFFLWLLYIPFGEFSFRLVATVFFMFNLTANWAWACALRPICGTIFHDSYDRAQVLALWLALEGIVSSFCGAPLVGLLSESSGYRLPETPSRQDGNATALRTALVGGCVIPWIFCTLAWIPMYWTYPRDLALAVKSTNVQSAYEQLPVADCEAIVVVIAVDDPDAGGEN